jgi:hypothetical protein
MAVASFLFYRALRYTMRFLLLIYAAVLRKESSTWRPLSAESFKNPLALPLITTVGPRWNTHAILATVGPLHVKHSLAVDVSSAKKSARSWTLVVCTFPGYRTVTTIDSLNSSFENDSAFVQLSPGRYWIALRYYQWSNDIEFPAVRVDGVITVDAKRVAPGVNDFYRNLLRRNYFFYFCLHYYVFVLLQMRNRFPKSFVEKEFLPQPNPETKFYYGVLTRGESLSIELSSSLLRDYHVYLTFYDRASFPIAWQQITQERHVTPRSRNNCFYLFRFNKARALDHPLDENSVNISVIR